MFQTVISASNRLTLDQVVAWLRAAPDVDGVALFGSSRQAAHDPASDYDLLVMLDNPTVQIFQMQTYIDGKLADVAFVETETAERVLALELPVGVTSREGFLIGWLEQAQILYDRSGRLAGIQQKIAQRDWRISGLSESDAYAEWFWLNFDLRHIQRMAAAHDPIYGMVVDMRVMFCLAQMCRTYCRLRGIHWRGEKAALRTLQAHDPDFFDLLQRALHETDCVRRITLCEQLIARTLENSGGLWPTESTAVYLKNAAEHAARVGEALALWEGLVGGGRQRLISMRQ
jgi:predicted nucleotidyltransferase